MNHAARRRRAAALSVFARLLPYGLLCVAATTGCANRDAAVRLADQLIVNERIAYAARERDLDAVARLSEQSSALLRAECEQAVAARAAEIEARLVRTEHTLWRRFEVGAWQLQWEQYPRAAEVRLSEVSRLADDAVRQRDALRVEADDRPNDARLRVRAEAAAAEAARLQRERLAAELDGAYALAEGIEALRATLGDRIAAGLAPVRAELAAAIADPCVDPGAIDPDRVAARRASYAALHSGQIEGLATLRDHVDRPSVARLVVAGSADALKQQLTRVLPDSIVSPLVDAGLARIETSIDGAERDLGESIDRGLDALRADLEPGP